MRGGGPRLDGLDNVQHALHYAVVCQNKDPENLERIKVRIPTLDGGDQDQTHWAQYVTTMEGKEFGWYSLPDIDDVVIVMFVGGDIRQPVIVGGIWSKPDESPEPNEDGKNNFRGYRSRSGHRLILDDSSKVKVVLADKTTKNMMGLGEFAKDGAGPNVCAIYKPPMAGDKGISFSSMEGQLQITATTKLTIKAGQSIKINAKTTIDMKAQTIEMNGTTAKVTASAVANYDASMINFK